MQPEDTLDRTAVEQALAHHDLATAAILFRRLEDEIDGAGEIAGFGQIAGGPEQHGGMAVVAAGMHDARICRGIGQPGRLDDRQCVDVGTQPDRALRRLAAADHADDARPRESRHDLVDAEGLELLPDRRARPMLLEREFGMPVEVAPPSGHVVVEVGDAIADRHEAAPESM